MNRRSFLGSLFLIPTAVRAVALSIALETAPPRCRVMDEMNQWFAEANAKMHRAIFEHIARTNPFMELFKK